MLFLLNNCSSFPYFSLINSFSSCALAFSFLTFFSCHRSFSLVFYLLSPGNFFPSPLLCSHSITFFFFPVVPLLPCYSLYFPSLSSTLSTFPFYLSRLSSPLFVSPLFSSPVLSSTRPSVYPIWPSHLSWELFQGTRLLIQFLLNLMALGSAFAIPATCRETKLKKERDREAEKPVWIPQKAVP